MACKEWKISPQGIYVPKELRKQNLHLLQDNTGFAKQNKDFDTKLKIFTLVGIFTELSHEKNKTDITSLKAPEVQNIKTLLDTNAGKQ